MTKLSVTRTQAEDAYTYVMYDITDGARTIGSAAVMVDNDGAYCDRIDILPEFRRCGHGTEALRELSRIYGGLTIAPDNEDARRLYDRIGSEITAEYIDQGYGVYQI